MINLTLGLLVCRMGVTVASSQTVLSKQHKQVMCLLVSDCSKVAAEIS